MLTTTNNMYNDDERDASLI